MVLSLFPTTTEFPVPWIDFPAGVLLSDDAFVTRPVFRSGNASEAARFWQPLAKRTQEQNKVTIDETRARPASAKAA
jgi:hypothetical protein